MYKKRITVDRRKFRALLISKGVNMADYQRTMGISDTGLDNWIRDGIPDDPVYENGKSAFDWLAEITDTPRHLLILAIS